MGTSSLYSLHKSQKLAKTEKKKKKK